MPTFHHPQAVGISRQPRGRRRFVIPAPSPTKPPSFLNPTSLPPFMSHLTHLFPRPLNYQSTLGVIYGDYKPPGVQGSDL
ncbi:hypothetical protein PM082_024327 [Marasmius tenuissimus]|nr:hypothetical protein PM082_024327 [Marasmius tenuissimus]